jgi:hypothetical protein
VLQSIFEERYFMNAVSDGEARVFSLDVPNDVSRLKISLVWNDPAAQAGIDRALINDLDLELSEDASGIIHQPWVLSHFPHVDSLRQVARAKADHVNNVEQISVTNPAAGRFTIIVNGFNVPFGPQSFSVVYEFESGLRWTYPMASDAVEANKNTFARWEWNQPDKIARAEYSVHGSDEWISLGEVNLSNGYLEWLSPDENQSLQLRLLLDDDIVESGSFVVSRKINVQTGFNCANDALFFWNGEGTGQYKIFELTDNFLAEKAVTAELNFATQKTANDPRSFAVAPLIGDKEGVRSTSVYLNGPCFIHSFLARELVTDSVFLDLILTMHEGVESLTLERRSGTDYQPVQTIRPVTSNSHTFMDTQPLQEKNVYRIKLARGNQEIVYSDLESVWYTRDENLIVYPNPALQGESVSFVINSSPVDVILHDFTGRKIRHFAEDGEVKVLQTAGLNPGIYFLKVITGSGKILTSKILLR